MQAGSNMLKTKGLADGEDTQIRNEADLLGYRHQILGMMVACKPQPELEKALAASSQRGVSLSDKK